MENENIYIVAPNKSISCKSGVKGPKERITPKDCGSNFNILLEKGWIIKEENLAYKNEVQKIESDLAKPEKIEPVAKETPEEKPKRARKSVSSIGGAVKKE